MMTRGVGMLAAAVLVGLGALHAYWAAGGRWATGVSVPQRHDRADEHADDHVAFVPGPVATLIVAALLFAAALVMLGRIGMWGTWMPRWVFVLGAWTLVAVFAGRVVGDLRLFGIFKRVKGTPFAWWDTRFYTPLSAMLALAALIAAINGP
jgi:hypothetical protein